MCVLFWIICMCVTNERVGDEFPCLIRCESCLIDLTLRMYPCYPKVCTHRRRPPGAAFRPWCSISIKPSAASGLFLMPQFSPLRSISIWVSIYWGHQRTIYLALVPSPQRPRTLEARQISFRLGWFNHKPRLFDTNELIFMMEHRLLVLENLDRVIIITEYTK